MLKQLGMLEDYSLEVLKVYSKEVVNCEQTIVETLQLNKEELVVWLYDFFAWNEYHTIPNVEDNVCLECVSPRVSEVVTEYVDYNLKCVKCNHSVKSYGELNY